MNEGVGGGDGRKRVSFFSSLPPPRSFIGAIFSGSPRSLLRNRT